MVLFERGVRVNVPNDRMVEIDTADAPQSFIDVFSGTGMEEMVLNLRDMRDIVEYLTTLQTSVDGK